MADKEYHVVVKTDMQNDIPIGPWTVDQAQALTWMREWLPGGEHYERFTEQGEQVEYVKVYVRDFVAPDWMANVE